MYGRLIFSDNISDEKKKKLIEMLNSDSIEVKSEIGIIDTDVNKYSDSFEIKNEIGIIDTNVNKYRDDWGSHFEIAYPGVAKEDLSVNFNENNQLVITRNTEKDGQEPVKNYVVKTIRYVNEFTIDVDKDLFNIEGIKVKYENGLLYVAIPFKEKKEQETKAFAINIE